jgi:tripartite-type tricarboxylate transporter receptor subunit TctC
MFPDLPYTLSDFDILGQIGLSAAVFVVRADSPIKSVRSFAKDIGSLTNVNIAVGAVDSMANANSVVHGMKLTDAKVVNFRSINDALISTLGGHTTMAVLPGNFPTIWQMVKTGELRVIGSSGPYEISIDGHKIPSLTESIGIPGFMGGTWLAVHPKSATNDQMTTTLKQIIHDPEFYKEIAHLILIRDNNISMQSLINQAKKYHHYIKNN